MISPGSFDEAFDGCEYVLHTASPYVVNVPLAEVQERLIKPAVAGTENVLGEGRAPRVAGGNLPHHMRMLSHPWVKWY